MGLHQPPGASMWLPVGLKLTRASLPRARPVDPKSSSASRSPPPLCGARLLLAGQSQTALTFSWTLVGWSDRTLARCPLPAQDTLTGPGRINPTTLWSSDSFCKHTGGVPSGAGGGGRGGGGHHENVCTYDTNLCFVRMGPSWGQGLRRCLQFCIFMTLPLHRRNNGRFPAPHGPHCLCLAFCSLSGDRPPPPGFPPSPAPPLLILRMHCEPRAPRPSPQAPGPTSLLPPVLPGAVRTTAEAGIGSGSRPIIWEPADGLGVQAPLPRPVPTAPGVLCPSLSLPQLNHPPRESRGLVSGPGGASPLFTQGAGDSARLGRG